MIGARLAAFSQSGRAFAPPVIGIQFASTLAIPSLVFTSGAGVSATTPVVFSGGVMPYSITVSPLIPGLTVRASDGQINAGTAGAITASATYRFTGVDALSNTTFKDVTITIQAPASSAPSWTDPTAVQPGFVFGSTQRVGFAQQLSFGAAANSPTNYDYQMILNGTDIPGATGTSVTTAPTYAPAAAGELAFRLTAKNAAGSATTTTASITITT